MTPLYLVTDTETTGLDKSKDEVYEVAMTAMTQQNIIFRYQAWVKLPPNQEISQYTLDSPNYKKYALERGEEGEFDYEYIHDPTQVRQQIVKRVKMAQERTNTDGKHTYLVGSNPSFDRFFISRSLELELDTPLISHKMIDLSNIAMAYFRSARPIGQTDVMKRLNLGDQTHGAQADVQAAVKCFRKMGSHLW